MSGIPAGSIVHMGGRTVINRLQDAGLQDPRVPTQTIYETGNDLVVGKILTEADFRFQLTSWDVSCDLMALITGEHTTLGNQISGPDPVGTEYKWEDCGFINITSPWKDNVGTDGGDVSSGVIVPNLYPTQLSYRLGVTDNAQMQVTLSTGSYFMDGNNYPIEEYATGDGSTAAFNTSEPANAYRVGGAGSTAYQHVFGVMVNHVPQIPGIDYVESGFAAPEVTQTTGTITFTTPPPNNAVVQWCYFTTTPHAIPQADNFPVSGELSAPTNLAATPVGSGGTFAGGTVYWKVTAYDASGETVGSNEATAVIVASGSADLEWDAVDEAEGYRVYRASSPGGEGTGSTLVATLVGGATTTYTDTGSATTTGHVPASNTTKSQILPAAVRGRDITVLLGDPWASPSIVYGIQSFELTASVSGNLQRQMGTQDPIGYARTGIDCNGTVTIEPKDKAHLFSSMALTLGLNESEVLGYINQETFPITIVIHEPGTQNIIKSIYVPDGMFQAPGENARVQTVTQFPIRFESFTGTFREIKGALPTSSD